MKTYQVILTKSYAVLVKAMSVQKAKSIAEFYTGDVKDISTDKERKKYNFSIKEIKCGVNETFGAKEIENGQA